MSLDDDEQAAAFYIRRQRDDWSLLDQAELDRWLSEPTHQRAFRRIEETWQRIEAHASTPELIVLRGDALRRSRGAGWQAWLRPGRWRWALAASVVLLLGAGFLTMLASAREVSYHTGFGQRRVVELTDHSQVALDQDTVMHVRMTRDARVIELLRGQAQFMVAHDRRRPFLVEVGPSTITAVGTSFNIEYLDAHMKLDMVEGRVLVAVAGPTRTPQVGSTPAELGRHPLDLASGEELTVAPGGEAQLLHNADVAAAIAWRNGKIIFKNTSLGDAVRRLNRYSRVQLRIVDPVLARERINGVFQLDDALVFADAIESTLGVQAHRIGSQELVLSPAR